MTARIAAPPDGVGDDHDATAFRRGGRRQESRVLAATPTGRRGASTADNGAITMVVDSASRRDDDRRIADEGSALRREVDLRHRADGTGRRSRSPNTDPSTTRCFALFRDSSWATRPRSTRICARWAGTSARADADRRRVDGRDPMGLETKCRAHVTTPGRYARPMPPCSSRPMSSSCAARRALNSARVDPTVDGSRRRAHDLLAGAACLAHARRRRRRRNGRRRSRSRRSAYRQARREAGRQGLALRHR